MLDAGCYWAHYSLESLPYLIFSSAGIFFGRNWWVAAPWHSKTRYWPLIWNWLLHSLRYELYMIFSFRTKCREGQPREGKDIRVFVNWVILQTVKIQEMILHQVCAKLLVEIGWERWRFESCWCAVQVKSFADVCRCKIKPAEVSGAFDWNAEILIPSNWSCENSYWDHFFSGCVLLNLLG